MDYKRGNKPKHSMDELIETLKETGNVEKAAEKLGYKRRTIYCKLIENGINLREVLDKKTSDVILNERASEVVSCLLDKKLNIDEVGVRFGVLRSSVICWQQKNGFQITNLRRMDPGELASRCVALEKDPKRLAEIERISCEREEFEQRIKKEIEIESELEALEEKQKRTNGREKRESEVIPGIGEVQAEARKHSMSYGQFVLSREYQTWRSSYKKKTKKK